MSPLDFHGHLIPLLLGGWEWELLLALCIFKVPLFDDALLF